MIGNILMCITGILGLVVCTILGICLVIWGIKDFKYRRSKIDGMIPFCGGIFALFGVLTAVVVIVERLI